MVFHTTVDRQAKQTWITHSFCVFDSADFCVPSTRERDVRAFGLRSEEDRPLFFTEDAAREGLTIQLVVIMNTEGWPRQCRRSCFGVGCSFCMVCDSPATSLEGDGVWDCHQENLYNQLGYVVCPFIIVLERRTDLLYKAWDALLHNELKTLGLASQ